MDDRTEYPPRTPPPLPAAPHMEVGAEGLSPGGEALLFAASPGPRGRPVLAWIVIAALVAGVAVLQQMRQQSPPQPAAELSGEGTHDFARLLQARYLVGAAELLGQPARFYPEAERALNTGGVGERLRFVAVAGELQGPAEALEKLQQLDQSLAERDVQPTAEQTSLRDALRRWYELRIAEQGRPPTVADEDRALIVAQLGWYGELALAPAGADPAAREAALAPARKVFAALIAVVLGAVAGGTLGLGGLVGLLIYWLGSGRPRLSDSTGHGGVYAETFALWMLLYLGLSAAVPFLVHEPSLLYAIVVSLLSMAALAWPVVRGIPWRTVREEIGWTLGRRPVLEPLCGVASYAMLLPLLGVGLLLTLLLMRLTQHSGGSGFDPQHAPMHPIVPLIAGADGWRRAMILLLAAVSAPILEETMFRGVLYRHLRDASAGLRTFLSIVISVAVSSFVFAVIHPQGLVAVPALMGIAAGLCLAREWRGTLIPGMVAHGLHNGALMLLLMQLAG